MTGFWEEWPYLAVWGFFFLGALARGCAVYWVGRGARHASRRHRPGHEPGPLMLRAERLVSTYGVLAVPACFLTVGVQSAVLATCGALRMPARRFAPALVVGAAIWATVYTTVGMAAFLAMLGREPLPLAIAALGSVVLVGTTTWLSQREPRAQAELERRPGLSGIRSGIITSRDVTGRLA